MVRIKHRYLLINILYPSKSNTTEPVPDIIQFNAPTPGKFDVQALLRTIRNNLEELFGDYGLGMVSSSLKIIYLSTATSTAIIRVSRDHYRLVWSALTFITKLPKPNETPCVIRVVRNSGTIRKAEEEAIRRAKDSVVRARQALGKDSRSENIGVDLFREHDTREVKDGAATSLGLSDADEEDGMSDSDDND